MAHPSNIMSCDINRYQGLNKAGYTATISELLTLLTC